MGRINTIKEFLVERPQDTFLNFALAKEFENKEMFEEAIQQYQNVIEMDDQYIGAYYHLAQLLIAESEQEKAKEIINIGIQKAENLGRTKDVAELNGLRAYV